MPWRCHERFRERFARFEPGCRCRRPEEPPARRRKAVGDAQAQRQFRTDDCQVDVFALGERQRARRVGSDRLDRSRDQRAIPGFPGAQTTLGDAGFGGQPTDQRVLARAAAEDENLHCLNELWRVPALHTADVWMGTISLTVDSVCA